MALCVREYAPRSFALSLSFFLSLFIPLSVSVVRIECDTIFRSHEMLITISIAKQKETAKSENYRCRHCFFILFLLIFYGFVSLSALIRCVVLFGSVTHTFDHIVMSILLLRWVCIFIRFGINSLADISHFLCCCPCSATEMSTSTGTQRDNFFLTHLFSSICRVLLFIYSFIYLFFVNGHCIE